MKTPWFRFNLIALVALLASLSPAWTQEKRGPFQYVAGERSPRDLPNVGSPTASQVIDPETPFASYPLQTFSLDSPLFNGRWSVRSDIGDSVGYTRGVTYVEAMLPIRQDPGSLLFADIRVVNFDHENRWEYNIGGGYRWYSPAVNHVLGVNAFYDARKTDYHYYQQIGCGIEVLGQRSEFRSNAYAIIGPAHRLIGDTGFVNQGISNGNFVSQRRQVSEVAYSGVDVEFGVLLPFLERCAPRVYIGGYTYFADNVLPPIGVRGRLEAQLTERISLHFTIQNDRTFHSTVSGGLAIHFGAPAYRTGTSRPSWDDVLSQRVNRHFIVIGQAATTSIETQPVPPPPPPPPPPIEEQPGEG